ncbi:unnamed protein product, partial [Brassica oleracea var. botrytis]
VRERLRVGRNLRERGAFRRRERSGLEKEYNTHCVSRFERKSITTVATLLHEEGEEEEEEGQAVETEDLKAHQEKAVVFLV